jgi:hypothetical protein
LWIELERPEQPIESGRHWQRHGRYLSRDLRRPQLVEPDTQLSIFASAIGAETMRRVNWQRLPWIERRGAIRKGVQRKICWLPIID